MPITRKIDVEFNISPHEIAREFCGLDADGQARFFNSIAAIAIDWKHPFETQLTQITHSRQLTDEGRGIMRQIGEYAAP